MLQNLRFIVEGDCPDCEGYGVLYNGNWDEFKKWREEWQEANPPPSEGVELKEWKTSRRKAEEEWWSNLGYSEGRSGWPSEEVDCAQCNGTGTIQMAISPAEARAYLGL